MYGSQAHPVIGSEFEWLSTTETTGDNDFQQYLVNYGISTDEYESPDGTTPLQPSNLDDILRVLANP
ncbi:hypothetical protein F5Y03DRAFT_400975 [Xylaria venustula]|nr:hypothetical protein F5Y03DRAFT_400975 [Xylaria venustula]